MPSNPIRIAIPKLLGIALMLLCALPAFAQLKADFIMDKPGGCSPATVSFTNKTTGASGSATFKWDFGNGNTSSFVNAGATYKDEKSYTVTLTVTDGGVSSTKTQTVTVYKKPVVDFSAATTRGCLPLPVTFNSSSTAGDGTIANYFWDYGDGNTQQGGGLKQPSHTYQSPQNTSVSLTVTNSHGCYNTIEKKNIVEILPSVTADFTTTTPVLCSTTESASFNGTATGPGTLSYNWDFGDSKAGTGISTTHDYANKGSYNVKLTVKSSEGCSASTTKNNFINVANFTTDFQAPAQACVGTQVNFFDKSTSFPALSQWQFEEGGFTHIFFGTGYNFYSTPGTKKVKLTNTYGNCTQTAEKTITINALPKSTAFVADMNGVCGAPVTVKFKDTTPGATKWSWNFNWPYTNASGTTQAPSNTYSADGLYQVLLTVTNAAGCTNTTQQYVNVKRPNVMIAYLSSTSPPGNSGCPGFTMKFTTVTADTITSFKWDFGDGTSSSEAQPEKFWNTPGIYTVKYSYTTSGGCKDVANYLVSVYKKPKADFSAPPGNTCGNTPVQFTDRSSLPVNGWQWDFGDNTWDYNFNYQHPQHQYWQEGTYNVRLIAFNGTCADTITKTNIVTVKPPFPKISSVMNTCSDTRGEVTFQQTSRNATGWKWDFGDGTSETLAADQLEIKHTYKKTGTFKVVLTTTNGACSVRDSVTAMVLLKQKPMLTLTKTEVCASGTVELKINNVEPNPVNFSSSDYYYSKMIYDDETPFQGWVSSNQYYWSTSYSANAGNFTQGKDSIRAIIQSDYFGCLDTTNFATLKIKGPIVGYKVVTNDVCYKTPIVFEDTSKADVGGAALVKWEWDFGDSKTATFNKGGTVTHAYSSPGWYSVALKVTDKDGCFATSNTWGAVSVKGPKADFYHWPANVSPNNPVTFYNNTNNSNTNYSSYEWVFADGTRTVDYYPTRTYTALGVDTVRLIAKDQYSGCTDTALKVIQIKNVNASFNFTSSYINNNSCPPVVVRFTNTSANARSIAWDFGDGGVADNLNNPSHTYFQPGIYKVTLYAYGDNNAKDSIVDSIEVKGPYAILKADILSGCQNQTVTLSAEVRNASSFTWDFADGSLQQTSDTFAVHKYVTPGIYKPAMILKDSTGCSGTSELQERIIIDDLAAAIHRSPAVVCDSAIVSFEPDISSVSYNQLQMVPIYKWDFGTGNPTDTSFSKSSSFRYRSSGKYPASLRVETAFGCVQEVIDTIHVKSTIEASITAPAEICVGANADFEGTAATPSASYTWSWNFKNGNSSSKEDPGTQKYNQSGNYDVSLILDNGGCKDTALHRLIVYALPQINLRAQQDFVCLGNRVQLFAQDGISYKWFPATGLDNPTSAQPFAAPTDTRQYTVTVTSVKGCVNRDSLILSVAKPFNLSVAKDTFVCRGDIVQLYANGTDHYQWINQTDGLSNTSISNPVSRPSADIEYTVRGYDRYGCFSDTAAINLSVKDLPWVNAGPDIELLTGSTYQFNTTYSSDVSKWYWTQPSTLSCLSCAQPIASPRTQSPYIVTVKNQYGCAASDTVSVKLVCAQSKVYIPNTFTPNGDRNNEFFYIQGRGIKSIRSLRIFNRWGQVVYERSHVQVNDVSTAWDGTVAGKPVPVGTYVYFAEMECDTGELFNKKGSITIIR